MHQTIKIAILATGDELTLGSILNTNAQAIAQELFSLGFEPSWQMAVPDDTNDIESALEILSRQHSIVITIGGLGPTSDDKTRFSLASFLKEPLTINEFSLNKLLERYQKINIPFTELSRQQALFPEQAEILENSVGSANGCVYKFGLEHQKMIFMLPGPPRECLPMFREKVLPHLMPLLTVKRTLLQWKVFGIAEGAVAEKVDNALQAYASICRTSFRWDYPYVDCKVLLDEDRPEKEDIFSILNPILLPYQLDPVQNQRATERLKNLLKISRRSVVIQDKATGGILESLVHSQDNHAFTTFGQATDQAEYYFLIEGLENYWNRQEEAETELCLSCNGDVRKFTIPYRQVLLEIYAAEFIAHQIFIYLNEGK